LFFSATSWRKNIFEHENISMIYRKWRVRVRVIVLNATFINISAISWKWTCSKLAYI